MLGAVHLQSAGLIPVPKSGNKKTSEAEDKLSSTAKISKVRNGYGDAAVSSTDSIPSSAVPGEYSCIVTSHCVPVTL